MSHSAGTRVDLTAENLDVLKAVQSGDLKAGNLAAMTELSRVDYLAEMLAGRSESLWAGLKVGLRAECSDSTMADS